MKRVFKIIAIIVVALLVSYGGSILVLQYKAYSAGIVPIEGSGVELIDFDGVLLHIPPGWSGYYYGKASVGDNNSWWLTNEDGSQLQGGRISTKTLSNYAKAANLLITAKSDITSRYSHIKDVVSVVQREYGDGWISTEVLCRSRSGGIEIFIHTPKTVSLPDTLAADGIMAMFVEDK